MTMTELDNTIMQITEAFRDTRLGDGVSLREADVIDDYGTDDEREAARRFCIRSWPGS